MRPYMRKSCNPTCKKFYEDFDLLPREVKELLWYGARSPTFEDLKEAWKLAGESWDLKRVMDRLNVFEEDRKAKKAADRKAELEAKRRERNSKFAKRGGYVQMYRDRVVTVPRDKDARLIALVKDEQALEMLSKRKENKDVKQVGTYVVREFVGWKKVEPAKDETNYMSVERSLTISKQLHNS